MSVITYVALASDTNKQKIMLETIAIVLLVLWLLGIVTSYTIGGFIHILLVLAVALIIYRLVQGKPVV